MLAAQVKQPTGGAGLRSAMSSLRHPTSGEDRRGGGHTIMPQGQGEVQLPLHPMNQTLPATLTASLRTTLGVRTAAARCAMLLAAVLVLAMPSCAFLVAQPRTGGLLGVGRVRERASPTSRSTTMMAYDIRYSPNKWNGEEIEPGFGGVWPGDPDAQTHNVSKRERELGTHLSVVSTDSTGCPGLLRKKLMDVSVEQMELVVLALCVAHVSGCHIISTHDWLCGTTYATCVSDMWGIQHLQSPRASIV